MGRPTCRRTRTPVSAGASDRIFHSTRRLSRRRATRHATLDIVRGFEHAPAHVEVDVKAGDAAVAMVRLNPIVELADLGWYGGSTHVHMNYAG